MVADPISTRKEQRMVADPISMHFHWTAGDFHKSCESYTNTALQNQCLQDVLDEVAKVKAVAKAEREECYVRYK